MKKLSLFFGEEDRVEAMSQLAQEIERCRECPLYQSAKNPVPGEGRVPSDLMLVGEGPGFSEDRHCRSTRLCAPTTCGT